MSGFFADKPVRPPSLVVKRPSSPSRAQTPSKPPTPSKVASSSPAPAPAKSKGLRAHALFYDDTAENFAGSGPRGKYPHIICQRLTSPLTVMQLTQALGLFEQRTDPLPFFFFDFDGTLTLADGLLQLEGGSLERLFGGVERRKALQRLLVALLEARQVYVLTANPVLNRVADALNALLAQGGAKGKSVSGRFQMEDTVRWVARGDKLRVIEAIVAERGYALVNSNQK